MSAEPDIYLVVALSGRALAAAIRRAGRRSLVVDLFGDTDTQSYAEASVTVAGDIENGFDAVDLLRAAAALAPAAAPPQCSLVYGSGLESRPDLLARLAQGRHLCGNSPDTVARTKDPRQFFALLDRLGIPFPAVAFTRPDDPQGWLSKRCGGAGGGHILPTAIDRAPQAGTYFQRRAPGRPVGVSFLADGRSAFVLGCSEQWLAPTAGLESFRFGGIVQPAVLGPRVMGDLPSTLDALVRELGLVGLNSLDMMVDGDDWAVLEVNPRPGANLDIFDGGASASLFELHVAACRGRLPQRWATPRAATAMSFVYAERPRRVPADVKWPAWVADRPAPGAGIAAGWPLCTVLAAEPAADLARRAIAARADHVLSILTIADDEADTSTVFEPSLIPPAPLHPDGAGHAQ